MPAPALLLAGSGFAPAGAAAGSAAREPAAPGTARAPPHRVPGGATPCPCTTSPGSRSSSRGQAPCPPPRLRAAWAPASAPAASPPPCPRPAGASLPFPREALGPLRCPWAARSPWGRGVPAPPAGTDPSLPCCSSPPYLLSSPRSHPRPRRCPAVAMATTSPPAAPQPPWRAGAATRKAERPSRNPGARPGRTARHRSRAEPSRTGPGRGSTGPAPPWPGPRCWRAGRVSSRRCVSGGAECVRDPGPRSGPLVRVFVCRRRWPGEGRLVISSLGPLRLGNYSNGAPGRAVPGALTAPRAGARYGDGASPPPGREPLQPRTGGRRGLGAGPGSGSLPPRTGLMSTDIEGPQPSGRDGKSICGHWALPALPQTSR